MTKYLITGVLGFIGSFLAKYIIRTIPDATVVGLARNTNQSHLRRLEDVQFHPRFNLIYKDFAKDDISEIFNGVDAFLHLGSKTFVDHSVVSPSPFIESNIIGTWKILEEARKAKNLKKLIIASTDEVYGPIAEGSWTEESPLKPTNPYSASKAAADLIALSYQKTYGLPLIITRAENIYGPYQEPVKVIPAWVKRALNNEPLLLYGDGKHKRKWLHVEDACRAILHLVDHGKVSEIYNIAGDEELENIWLAAKILEILKIPIVTGSDKPGSFIFIPDKDIRPFHDRRYSIDASKLKATGWEKKYTLDERLRETIFWYKNNLWWLQ